MQKTSTLAIVALVFSILCAPIGLILGIIALIRINDSKGMLGGKGLAIAAIVMPAAAVPIIGILSAIAIPNFIRYQLRSKTTESRTNLGAIKTYQEQFFAERNAYVSAEANPGGGPTPMKSAWEDRPCPAACKSDPSACTEFSCLGFSPAGPTVYYQYACNAKDGDFVCVAVGDLDGDGDEGAFIYGSGNSPGSSTIRLEVPEIASSACTGSYPVNQVSDCKMGTF
jgi:type IV pilus assembly protein PilA